MRDQPPQKTALQVVGLLAGSASVLYFAFAGDLGLSPVTTAAVGLLVAVGLAAASLSTADAWDAVSLYLLAGVAFLGASVRLVQVYSLGDAGTLAVLLVLTAVALGASRSRGRLSTPSSNAIRYALVAVVALSVAVVGVDLGTGDVSHSVEIVDGVTASAAEEEVRLGTVTYRNPSPIPKEAGSVEYRACLVGVDLPDRADDELYAGVDYYSNRLVAGGGSHATNLTTHLPRDAVNETTTFGVVRTDACPESAAAPTIAVYERSGSR